VRNYTLEPSQKQAYVEMLHKKDMQNVKYCSLDFGSVLVEKKVRDRAIAERVESIKFSHSNKLKFEQQFREARAKRKESMFN